MNVRRGDVVLVDFPLSSSAGTKVDVPTAASEK
jgi:hypothetical protein